MEDLIDNTFFVGDFEDYSFLIPIVDYCGPVQTLCMGLKERAVFCNIFRSHYYYLSRRNCVTGKGI